MSVFDTKDKTKSASSTSATPKQLNYSRKDLKANLQKNITRMLDRYFSIYYKIWLFLKFGEKLCLINIFGFIAKSLKNTYIHVQMHTHSSNIK